MKNFLIQASTMIAGEDEKDAIIKFADMIKQNPDTKNVRWNTVLLSNSVQEEPDKDIKNLQTVKDIISYINSHV